LVDTKMVKNRNIKVDAIENFLILRGLVGYYELS
jgi:hypothetical protein